MAPEGDGRSLPSEITVMCAELRTASESLREAYQRADSTDDTGLPARRAADLYGVEAKYRPYQRRILAEGTALVRMAGAVVLDHANAIIAVLEGEPGPLWSHLSLSRPAIESALRACEIFDPQCIITERTARISGTLIDSAQEQVTLAHQFGEPHVETAERYLSQTVARVKRAGFETDIYRNKIQKIRFQGDRAWRNVKADVTSLARRWIPDTRSTYTLGSGAAHGSIWMTIQNYEEGGDGTGRLRPQADSLGAGVMAVIDAIYSLCTVIDELYDREAVDLRNARGWSLARVVKALRP